MKIKLWHAIVIAAAILILTPTFLRYGGTIANYIFGEEEEIVTGTVAVNKVVRVTVIDEYAGSGVTGATVDLYDGVTKLESLTDNNDGTYDTASTYPSGEDLTLKIVKSNSKIWVPFTVPRMSPQDAESATVNSVDTKFFTIATLTDSMMDGSGTSYADGATYNKTATGNLVTFTYSLFVGTDNTGYKESYDPINELNWYAVIYYKFSGTNYENIVVTGLDNTFEKGTALYGYIVVTPTEVTKYKVGNTYVHDGSTAETVSLDLSGYSGDAASMQINVKWYSDPSYFSAKGSYGPDVLATDPAEHTILLKD